MEKTILQIASTELNIGTKKEYRFFQISDMHLSVMDDQSSELDINDNKRCHKQWDSLKYEFAQQHNELCDERYDIEPNIIFEMLCDYAVSQKVDTIIFSGDIFDRVTDSNIRYLKRLLKDLPMPAIYCPGNHEYMSEIEKNIDQKHRLIGLLDTKGIEAIEYDDFLLVAFDNGSDIITDYQIEKLEELINTNKKIILAMHKPLLLGEFGDNLLSKIGSYFFMGKESDCKNVKKIVSMIKENDDRFIAVLCGHIHSAHEYKITKNLKQISTSSGLIGAGRIITIKWG